MRCPCHSGKLYETCCEPFHKGQLAPNAMLLMRSRYAAYALKLAEYIMKTTHPDSPQFKRNSSAWNNDILYFCQNTLFEGLEIGEFVEEGSKATVTFLAKLIQNGTDASFIEKSSFEKLDQRWLYLKGVYGSE